MSKKDHLNRRDFLKGITATSLGLALAVEEIVADAQGTTTRTEDRPTGPPIHCAVIGLGAQGRDILAALAKMDNAPTVALCDNYTAPGYIKRATDIAPKAAFHSDYRRVLEMPTVQAVFVATPSHRHKQIVVDALAAGKHVYCEAPLASHVEEAREIARAGLAAKTLFQAGLQYRANKQHNHVLNFMRSGVLGRACGGRAQWHKKGTWKRGAPTPERGRELNWRLYKETSSGLPGEVGIHQLDIASWYLKALPVSVIGFGGVLHWTQDGMQVPDTIQCLLEYPNNVRFFYDATLVSSFDGAYEMFMGSECAVLLRDQRAWMFKEADSRLLGWEVYARKDKMGVGEEVSGTGIALVADATKLLAQGKEPSKVGADVTKTALYRSLDAFLECIRTNKKPVAGPLEGFQANVVAAKTHEAVMTSSKVVFQKEWFTL